ncbi:hypothetical protein [Kribbella sp. NPDC006257]|uniref:hypothetical protein n=1 Tax=Kribbella sp. NPDC006257 TaxID=3156738 RepID=UPI0033B34D69
MVDETDPVAEEAAWAARAELAGGGMARVERLPGNVGLLEIRPLLFDPMHVGARASAAMSLLSATDALLIDLRRRLGGSPDMVLQQLGRATVVGECTGGGAHPRAGRWSTWRRCRPVRNAGV